jgi:beta-glucanase (GH16 family)
MRFVCLYLIIVGCASCSSSKKIASNNIVVAENVGVTNQGIWGKNRLLENSTSFSQAIALKSTGSELLMESMKLSPISNAMKLVWSDEFNYKGLPDSTRWNYDIGDNGWGNNELQYYTEKDSSTAMVEGGHLKITVRKNPGQTRPYTSARLLTKNKVDFKYGRIEARAKLPAAVGTWPAIWMLGSDIDKADWPDAGEIDIMEHRGMELNKIFGTLHYPGHSGGNANGNTIYIPTATSAFHIYAVEWTASDLKFYVDDVLFHSVVNNENMPFHHPFFILLNIAIGGDFGGKVDSLFSIDAMEIDYVRVYQTK